MNVGVVADTHDNWPNLDEVCRRLSDIGVTVLLHCGDVCAPATLLRLLERFKGEVHLVNGNVDGDPYLMSMRTRGHGGFHYYGVEMGEAEIGQRRVGLQHFPLLARGLAMTGAYDAVFYGHDHLKQVERLQVAGREVLLANPGTLGAMGRPPSYGLYDPGANDLRLVELS